MSASRLQLSSSSDAHPKLGRFLVASLVVHALTVALLVGGWFGSPVRVKPPAYFVDLVHKPVLNPQAGRPDPRPEPKAKPAPAAVQKPPAVQPEPKPKPKPEPKPEPVKSAPPEPKPVPKPQPKPQPAPKPQPRPQPDAEQQRQAAVDALRQKQASQSEIEALKERLARLQEAPAGAAAVSKEIPVGMPDGSGDEIGIAHQTYIREHIKQNWALSAYLVEESRRTDIEAKVTVVYSADGELVGYPQWVERSGNEQFDASVMRAIIKSKQLAHKLPRRTEMTIVFNLDDLVANRR